MRDKSVPVRKSYQPQRIGDRLVYDGYQPTKGSLDPNNPPGSNKKPANRDSRQSKDSSNDS